MQKKKILILISIILFSICLISRMILETILNSFLEPFYLVASILLIISIALMIWSKRIRMHFYASFYIFGIALFIYFIKEGTAYLNKDQFALALSILTFIIVFLIFDYLFLQTHSILNVLKISTLLNVFSFILMSVFVVLFVLCLSFALINYTDSMLLSIGILDSLEYLFAIGLPIFGLYITKNKLN